MIIYKATNVINNKVYIGKTKRSLKERKREHLRDMKKCKYYFYNALNKYGFDNFKWEVIDNAETNEELNDKEKYWIEYYKSYDDKHGYNSTLGGEVSWAETHKNELSEIMRNYYNETEVKTRMRSILIYDINGNFITKCLGMSKFCKENNISNGSFHGCLNGRGVSINGYIPIYESEFTEELLKEKLERVQVKNNSKILMYRVDDDSLIGEFNSQTEISKIFNIPLVRINGCLNGRQNKTKGFYFKWK